VAALEVDEVVARVADATRVRDEVVRRGGQPRGERQGEQHTGQATHGSTPSGEAINGRRGAHGRPCPRVPQGYNSGTGRGVTNVWSPRRSRTPNGHPRVERGMPATTQDGASDHLMIASFS